MKLPERVVPCLHGCAGCDMRLAKVLARANRYERVLREIASEGAPVVAALATDALNVTEVERRQ